MGGAGGERTDASGRAARRRVLGAQVATFLVLGLGLVVWYGGLEAFGARFDRSCPQLSCDYARHFHPTIANLFHRGLPTRGYLYPPTFAILASPLGALDGATATWLWTGLQIVLLALWAIVPPHLSRRTPAGLAVAYTAATVLSVPALQVLKWGQLSTLLVTLGLAAYWAIERRREGLGAALLGTATALKLYPAIWFAWPLVALRWRTLLQGGAVAVALLVAVPAVVLGPTGTLAFYARLQTELEVAQRWIVTSIGSQYLPTVVARTTGTAGLRALLVPVGYGLALGALALLWRARDRQEDRALWSFAVAASLFPFVIDSSWLHYFVHLPVVWWVLLVSWPEQRRWQRGVVVATVTTSMAMTSLPWHELVSAGRSARYAREAWPLFADVLALVGLAVVLLPRARPDAPARERERRAQAS